MLTQLIFITLALSIDSFGIGVSYGIRKINFKIVSIFIISLISFLFTTVSISLGSLLSALFNAKITSFFSIFILIVLGLFIIKKGIEKTDPSIQEKSLDDNFDQTENIYSFFIKFLGITIKIIKTPSFGDLDNSSKIDPKEAFFLGVALSIDAMGTGFAVSSFNFAFLFPILIMVFQLIFLSSGIILGKNLKVNFLDETKISIFSGLILIIIGFLRLFLN